MSMVDPRHAPSSPEESSLWQRLMMAWSREDIACRHEIALQYTAAYPENIAGWIALADARTELAQYADALAALRCARRLAKSSPRHQAFVWMSFGHLYRARSELSLAIRYYRRAVGSQPTTSALIFLGAALAQRGDLAEAKRCHRRAARLATENPDEAFFNLGLILRAERRYDEAIAYFDEALKHDPGYAAARKARTDCVQALAVCAAHPGPRRERGARGRGKTRG
jgi:tetratricopeptide (TPR) repeat protein